MRQILFGLGYPFRLAMFSLVWILMAVMGESEEELTEIRQEFKLGF
jgi:hypothetical protein